ncbi:MAG: rRNA maturation RNase YbeY [Clostridia bacterium]|nr:rRNA maturation RNase YbeY [Clostridia bacterium]
MITFDIYCDEHDFSSLAKAFEGEFAATCKTFAEIVFVDENEIKELNAKFRSIDKVTDVLSFPTLDNILGKEIRAEDFPYDIDEDGALSLGSIAICKQVAERQAEEYGHSYERELYYLATHGVCHLLGYDHMNEEDKPKMRQMEEKILQKLGLSRTE